MVLDENPDCEALVELCINIFNIEKSTIWDRAFFWYVESLLSSFINKTQILLKIIKIKAKLNFFSNLTFYVRKCSQRKKVIVIC